MKTEINLFPQYGQQWFKRVDRKPVEEILKSRILDTLRYDDLYYEYNELYSKLAEHSIDALIYACMEYARFPRPYTEQERLEYLLNKCEDATALLKYAERTAQ